MIPSTRIVDTGASVIGRCRVEVLGIIDFTRVLGKRTPNLAIQSHMFNRTTNFTWERGIRIYSIHIHTVQHLSHSINFSRKQSKFINFKLTSNPLGLALFGSPLKIVERHLLNQIIGLIFSLIHQSSSCRCINSGPYRLGHTIVESLNNHPSLKAMLRA